MVAVTTRTVDPDEDGIRLDRWFKRHYPKASHGQIEKLARTGQIRIDGKRCKAGSRVVHGQAIRIPPGVEEHQIPAQSYKASDEAALKEMTLYQDDDVIVINKPSGLAVQGGSKTSHHLDAMMKSLAGADGGAPKLTHRLDKDTSGLLVVARNSFAASRLARSFQSREVEKLYWALCFGVPRPDRGQISSLMEGASEDSRGVRKQAQTRYRVIASAGQAYSWLALEPLTGRTHQLRIHCSEIGHPIVGDKKYAEKREISGRVTNKLHLHARGLRFAHPRSGQNLRFTAPLTGHMATTWSLFEFQAEDADAFSYELR